MIHVQGLFGFRRRLLGILSVVPILVTFGCQDGAGLAPVKGVVTKGGKPLAGVSVTFTQTEKNFSAAGLTNANGEFVLISQTGKAGAMPGKNKVTLTVQVGGTSGSVVNMADPSTAEEFMKQRDATLQSGKNATPKMGESSLSIPAEYSNPSKTPLSFEVTTGSNSFDVAIP